MRPLDELLVSLDDLINGDRFGWIKCKDVVVSELHDHIGQPGLAEHVTLESCQAIRAQHIMQQPVTIQSFVQHPYRVLVLMNYASG